MLVIGTILRMRVGRHGSGSRPRALLLRLTAATAFYAFVPADLVPSFDGPVPPGCAHSGCREPAGAFRNPDLGGSREHLQCVLLVVLLGCFWFAINVVPLSAYKDLDAEIFGLAFFVSLVLLPAGAIIIATVAPLRAVNQRLLFLVVGALALFALNAVSVFGLQRVLDAPKASGQSMLTRVSTPA
jgi:hypothetical protein